jgi:putative ABC transport system permease protein
MAFGIEASQERDFLTLVQTQTGKHLADTGENGVFVGYKLAEKLKAKDGDQVQVLVTTQTGSMNAFDLEIAGTFKSGVIQLDEGAFFIHHALAEKLLKTEGAPLLMVGFKGDDELVYQDKLKRLIRDYDPDLELVHWRQLAEFFDNTMGWVNIQFMVFRIIILIIATISIITVFMMGLMERMGEFGTMRAIGTHRGSIASMIFFEALLQSGLGSVLGVGLGILIIKLFLVNGLTMPPPPLMSVPFKVTFEIPWASIPLTLAMCVLVSGGAGILPALRMARIRIVEALGRNV